MKKLIKAILCCLPLKNAIVFESIPDFSDNTKAVFDEMLRRGYAKKMKLIWLAYDECHEKVSEIQGARVISVRRKPRISAWWIRRSKYLVFCNCFLGGGDSRQIRFYLGHGSPIKDARSYYTCPPGISAVICTGEGMRRPFARAVNYDFNRVMPLGYPRNDELGHVKLNLSKFFGNYRKIIAWYPTVRFFTWGKKAGSGKPIPLIDSEENAKKINEAAKRLGVLIVAKPHFAQLTESLKMANYSNLRIIDDDFFEKSNMTSYEFIGSCDGLLTDYSSVYYDFMLVDKPIGLIWDDLDEYKKNPGVIEEFDYFMEGGEKLYTADDLCGFVERVANGEDSLRSQRNRLCDEVHVSRDGKNAIRVVDYFEEITKIRI